MLKQGLSKVRVLLLNVFSAFASFLGAILTYYFSSHIEGLSMIFISIASGFFLYIALSDLIPEIHHENKKGLALIETLWLLGGVIVIYFALFFVRSVLHINP
jgi:zinc and cadmium transporter